MFARTFQILSMSVIAVTANAGESADLRLRIAPDEVQTYAWDTLSRSDTTGQEKGKTFTLTSEASSAMTLIMRGMRGKPGTLPVSIRFRDFVWGEKRSIDDAKADAYVSRKKIKCSEGGKVTVDSENDIGLDRIKEYQQHIKQMEESEVRAVLESSGQQSDLQGDPSLVETMKSTGAHGIFPILPGKEAKPGDSWEDTFTIPRMGDFNLARAVSVRTKYTFSRWETKDGVNAVRIDSVSAWDSTDLKGENPDGMIASITNINSRGTGTYLFDPATGRYVEGTIEYNIKYKIAGELNGQTTNLEVTGKSLFNFQAIPTK